MRILQLHADMMEYQPIRKEIDQAEPSTQEKVKVTEVVVLFVTIETTDSSAVARKAMREILSSLAVLKSTRIMIYPYSHLSDKLAKASSALLILQELESLAREEGLEVFRSPFGWTKSFNIQVKGHPMAEQSKTFGPDNGKEEEGVSSAIKAEEKLKSEWFILQADGSLQPVSGYNFSKFQNLEKLTKYETQKVRTAHQAPPHVELMRRLTLADHESGSDPGNLRFYPKGRLVKSLLEQYVTAKVQEYGGVEVETPIMYDIHHPSLESYLQRFPARQYMVRSEDKDLFLRFSACFGQFLLAKNAQISYRQLPVRLYELTRYSFRREKRGELVGLRRLRAFTMPDCHALCSDMEQAKSEAISRFNLSLEVMKGIGLEKEDFELAIRFTRQFYNENRDFLAGLVKIMGKSALAEVWDERFFYFTMKWEFNFIDNLDKGSALSTDQIDVENGERFQITYADEKGEKKHPIILHNSPSGAIERCIYALLERAYRVQQQGGVPLLPTWLAPTQVRLIPVTPSFLERCLQISEELTKENLRVDIDDRPESVGKRIREGEREWIPYIIVLGEKEISSTELPIRDRRHGGVRNFTLHALISEVKGEIDNKPFSPNPGPNLVSKRPIF